MTRGQIKSRIWQRLNLTIEPGSVAGDPDAIDNIINQVTDEFAGPGLDCYWTSETTALVINQVEYCVPLFYKIKGAYWLDGSGNWDVLIPTTPTQMDRGSSSWRNDTGSTNLRYIVFEGVNRFKLYPYLNVAATAGQTSGGLKFEGFAQTNVSGISTWAADTTECPLPTWCHEPITYGAMNGICNMMLSSDLPGEVAKAQRLLPSIREEYTKHRGKAESAACGFYETTVRASLSSAWRSWSYT